MHIDAPPKKLDVDKMQKDTDTEDKKKDPPSSDKKTNKKNVCPPSNFRSFRIIVACIQFCIIPCLLISAAISIWAAV